MIADCQDEFLKAFCRVNVLSVQEFHSSFKLCILIEALKIQLILNVRDNKFFIWKFLELEFIMCGIFSSSNKILMPLSQWFRRNQWAIQTLCSIPKFFCWNKVQSSECSSCATHLLDYFLGEWKREKGLSSHLALEGFRNSFFLVLISSKWKHRWKCEQTQVSSIFINLTNMYWTRTMCQTLSAAEW